MIAIYWKRYFMKMSNVNLTSLKCLPFNLACYLVSLKRSTVINSIYAGQLLFSYTLITLSAAVIWLIMSVVIAS